MLSLVMPYIRDMEPRAIPPYQTFLKAQETYIRGRANRIYESQGHESPGIKLLRYILSFVDMSYLDQQANNYERYNYHVRFIQKDMMEIFDRVGRGRGYFNLFFKRSSFITEEFLLPILDVNTLTTLPLETEDWYTWKSVQPLYLWSHDSDEFTINILNDRITFRSMPPSYAVEMLDVVALIFKYYIWYKYQRAYEPASELAEFTPQQLFLHKYVMSFYAWDLSNVWLLNQLNRLFDITDRDQLNSYSSHSLQTEQQYGWVALNSRRGFECLWDLLYDLKRNLRPEALFSSKLLLGRKNVTLNERISYVDRRLAVPIHRAYEYYRWLRDKDILKFYVKVWSSRSNLPTAKRLFVNLRRDFNRVLLRRPWNTCNNVLLKNEIEREMTEFNEDLQKI